MPEPADYHGDAWKLEPDRSNEPRRDPGPINLQRVNFVPAYSGIPTFMGVPLCLNQADLRAGSTDVAILGAPIDSSLGMRGAAFGPRHIRADERILPNVPGLLIHPDTRIKPFETLNVYDYGDAAVDPLSIEGSHEPIRKTVREIAETGAIPVVLGGDHSILWPNCAAVADVYGAGNVGVIHFDTHRTVQTTSWGTCPRMDRRYGALSKTSTSRARISFKSGCIPSSAQMSGY